MANKVLDRFTAARRAGVSLVALQGPDPQATMHLLFNEAILKQKAKFELTAEQAEHVGLGASIEFKKAPVVQWDIVRGMRPWNSMAIVMLTKLATGEDSDGSRMSEAAATEIKNQTANNAVNALEFAEKFWPGTILFFLNTHRHLDDPATAQALWNLRDPYKADKRMVVNLVPDLGIPPSELKNDIVVIDEPYPTDRELEAIILKTYENAGLKKPTDDILLKAVDSVAGLAAFPAETSTAMALSPDGINIEILGEQRRQQVKGIPGAELYSGHETFADIIGCQNIISFYDALLRNPKERIRLLILWDEFEKMVAGTGDTSGTSQAMNEHFLSWTQNARTLGIIVTGVTGAGKTLGVKCAAGQFGIPLLMASLSGIKGSHVGESEANIRRLTKVADAMAAGGRILMVATSNQIAALTPEIQARFRLGTYFFDYPDQAERLALWAFYKKRFGLKDKDIPDSVNWVGREIEAACELAYLTDMPLALAAKRIVPACRAKAQEIEALKVWSSSKFISASKDGVFEYKPQGGVAAIGAQPLSRAVSVQ